MLHLYIDALERCAPSKVAPQNTEAARIQIRRERSPPVRRPGACLLRSYYYYY